MGVVIPNPMNQMSQLFPQAIVVAFEPAYPNDTLYTIFINRRLYICNSPTELSLELFPYKYDFFRTQKIMRELTGFVLFMHHSVAIRTNAPVHHRVCTQVS